MGLGHVGDDSGVAPLLRRASVRGDPFALVEEFHRMGADAGFELVFD